MADAVVVPCVTRLLPGGQGYRLSFGEPWENFPSGDVDADVARMNAEIEALVRTMPDQYYWVLKRFKTRPGASPDLLRVFVGARQAAQHDRKGGAARQCDARDQEDDARAVFGQQRMPVAACPEHQRQPEHRRRRTAQRHEPGQPGDAARWRVWLGGHAALRMVVVTATPSGGAVRVSGDRE